MSLRQPAVSSHSASSRRSTISNTVACTRRTQAVPVPTSSHTHRYRHGRRAMRDKCESDGACSHGQETAAGDGCQRHLQGQEDDAEKCKHFTPHGSVPPFSVLHPYAPCAACTAQMQPADPARLRDGRLLQRLRRGPHPGTSCTLASCVSSSLFAHRGLNVRYHHEGET
jgi:hypothetical protein